MQDTKKLNAGIAFLCLQNLDDQGYIDNVEVLKKLAERICQTPAHKSLRKLINKPFDRRVYNLTNGGCAPHVSHSEVYNLPMKLASLDGLSR